MAKRSTKKAMTPPDATHRVVVLCGKEVFLRSEFTGQLREKLEEAHGQVDVIRFDGENAQAAEVLDECRSFGLMAAHKLVIVENADKLVSESTRPLLERYAQAPSEGATLVLRASTWRKGNLDKAIEKVGVITPCDQASEAVAQRWAVRRCEKQHGGSISPQVAAMLVERTGPDLGRLDTELGKLSLAAGKGGEITPELIDELVGRTREEEVWSIQAELLSGDPARTVRHLRAILDHAPRDAHVPVTFACTDLARKLHAASRAIGAGSWAWPSAFPPTPPARCSRRASRRTGPGRRGWGDRSGRSSAWRCDSRAWPPGGAKRAGQNQRNQAPLPDTRPMRTDRDVSSRLLVPLAGSALTLALLAGCASDSGGSGKATSGEVITDVTPIEDVPASSTSSSLASLSDRPNRAPARATPDPSFIEMVGGAPETSGDDPDVEFLSYLGGVPEPEPAPVVEQVSASGRSHEQLAAELSRSLRELVRDADDPSEAFRAAAALAGLEAIHPGSIDRLEAEGVLSPEELEVVKAAAELTRAIGREGQLSDPGQAADTLDELSERLSSARGVRIATALLCTRVVGFGQYEEFPTNTFLAGRRQPVIIYTEMDRFTHKPITGEDGEPRYEIQLSQRLELYHLADGLNTWNRAAEVDRTVSRKKVNDYYLINQVVLPSTLSVGRYALKVVMRDLNDERGSVDEVTIPIEIVSDPALAYPNVSRASARP